MDLLIWWFSLRWLAQLLRSGDARSAGEELDRELDGVVRDASGCVRGALGCLVAYMVGLVIVGVVGAIVIVVGHWLTGR